MGKRFMTSEHDEKREKEAVKDILKVLDGFRSSETQHILELVYHRIKYETRFHLDDVRD